MRTVHQVNDDGFFVSDVRLTDDDATPADCVETHPADGMKWPRFVDGAWADAGVAFTRDPVTLELNFPPAE
jgi:hypothetical protein